ncbi:hypothetical protein [Streptomyces sp. LN704]|uniref:hypothetical protein n=1 Tax=Streptomyces sp. LN704 TaxID=3112982 RepID=UPI00371F9C7C
MRATAPRGAPAPCPRSPPTRCAPPSSSSAPACGWPAPTCARPAPYGPAPAGGALLTAPSGAAAQLAYGVEHAYRSGYDLWGSEGRLRLERAFSTPDEHVPVLHVERGGTVQEIRLAPDTHFTNIAGVFARAVLDGEDFTPHTEAVLAHARLVDEVEQAAATRPPAL